MTKREKDSTKRIANTSLLATAQRWLETAAALLYDNAQAAGRCTATARELGQVVNHGDQPDVPEDHSAIFNVFDAACKAHEAGQSVPVFAGIHYVESNDCFLFGEEKKITGGHEGESLVEALASATALCKSLGITASQVAKVERAVNSARFEARYKRELAAYELADAQEVK